MYVRKNFGFKNVMAFSGHHLIWLVPWMAAVTILYELTRIDLLAIPWLPLSVIGIAVAFYLGFKNNQSYDRLWEARKIWGDIESSSWTWGINIRALIASRTRNEGQIDDDLAEIHRKLIYRHITWLYALRRQLLMPLDWEHIKQNRGVRKMTQRRMNSSGIGLVSDDISYDFVNKAFSEEELKEIIRKNNSCLQIVDYTSQMLKDLRSDNLIDDDTLLELLNHLNDFNEQQGKCERINEFPLPRQYGSMSRIFVGIFIFLLPFGLVSEFAKLGEWGTWLTIPIAAVIAWVFLVMELVGDYSENPFEGLSNDIPMLSICRSIEIDLLEMIGEKDIPKPIEVKKGVLM